MSKSKTQKFADIRAYPNVFEFPYEKIAAASPGTAGRWGERVFGNSNPIVLELGCGRGEYTVGLARLLPECNFIGVDIKGARIWAGATEALRDGLKNAAFLRTPIEFIDRFFAMGEVSSLWLTFSDPQMKRLQKRLTSTFFLNRYRNFLKDMGAVNVKTDSNFLYTYTRCLLERNGLRIDTDIPDLHSALPSIHDPQWQQILSIRTYYEQQWLQRGISIKFLRFRLPAEGTLAEPEVEIEKDTYRSYNRNSRSPISMSK